MYTSTLTDLKGPLFKEEVSTISIIVAIVIKVGFAMHMIQSKEIQKPFQIFK